MTTNTNRKYKTKALSR